MSQILTLFDSKLRINSLSTNIILLVPVIENKLGFKNMFFLNKTLVVVIFAAM